MKMMLTVIMLLAVCACTETKKASFETVEDARRQARENATTIAIDWRRQIPSMADLEIYARGDSTISPECPQGDGWASIDLKSKDGQKLVKLKCSTVSLSISCLEEGDFKTKSYAQEDGKCNPDIPHPIPKLAK